MYEWISSFSLFQTKVSADQIAIENMAFYIVYKVISYSHYEDIKTKPNQAQIWMIN